MLDVSVEVSVEMPFDIRTIDSPSHSIRIKVSSNFFSLLMRDSEGLLTTEKRLALAPSANLADDVSSVLRSREMCNNYNQSQLHQIKIKSILFKLDSVRSGCPISRARGSCIKRSSIPDRIGI